MSPRLRRRVRPAIVLTLVVGLAAFSAACGGGGDGGANGDELKVAVPPVSAYVPVQVAVEKGYFAEEGLNVSLTTDIGGPQLIPAMLSGQVQSAGSIWSLVAAAKTEGLPVQAVAALTSGPADGADDDISVVSIAGSGIETAADLEGKTVGINTIKGLSEAQVRQIAADAGIDPYSVEFVMIPFQSMLGALRSGQIEAAVMSEPFQTLAKEQLDVNVIAGVNAAIEPLLPLGIVLMSDEYVADNPDVVRRYQNALRKAVEFCAGNPDYVRQTLSTWGGVPATVADKMALPEFVPTHELKGIQAMADLMSRYKVLDRDVDMSDAVIQQVG